MLGFWIDELARHAARVRFPRRVELGPGEAKVNLGSGLCVANGWINVDGSIHALMARAPLAALSMLYRSANSVRSTMTQDEYFDRLRNHDFVFADIGNGLPFHDEVVDYVYSSHVLEHFVLEDAKKLMRESFRVLKPGGVMRTCVPDLDHVLAIYRDGKPREAMRFFYAEEHVGTYHQHRYMYNYALLTEELVATGFCDIVKRAFRVGEVPDLEQLDNRPDETLYVEARKPR